MKAINASNYAKDHYYPKVEKAAAELLAERGAIAPVDLFVKLGFVSEAGLDEWRSGEARCLEDVLRCDMEKAARLLEILRRHAHDLKLKPAMTPYIEQRNGRRYLLRFTRKDDPAMEKAFARHFRTGGEVIRGKAQESLKNASMVVRSASLLRLESRSIGSRRRRKRRSFMTPFSLDAFRPRISSADVCRNSASVASIGACGRTAPRS